MSAPAVQENFFSAANLAWAAIGLGTGFYLEAWALTPGGQELLAQFAQWAGMIDPITETPGVVENILPQADADILDLDPGQALPSF